MHEHDIGIIFIQKPWYLTKFKKEKNIAASNLHKIAHAKFRNILLL